MQLKVKELNHPLFISALQKLDNCSKYPSTQVAWQVMKLVKNCHELIKEKREFYQKQVKEHTILDEQGNPKFDDKGQLQFKSPEDEAAHEKAFEEFMTVELEVKGRQLKLDELGQVGLSPNELEALEPLIDAASITE